MKEAGSCHNRPSPAGGRGASKRRETSKQKKRGIRQGAVSQSVTTRSVMRKYHKGAMGAGCHADLPANGEPALGSHVQQEALAQAPAT